MKVLLLSFISFSLAQTTQTQCLSEQEGLYHQQMEKLITDLSRFKIESKDFENKRAQLFQQLQAEQESCDVALIEEKASRVPASVENVIDYEEIEPSDVAE